MYLLFICMSIRSTCVIVRMEEERVVIVSRRLGRQAGVEFAFSFHLRSSFPRPRRILRNFHVKTLDVKSSVS